MAFDWLSDSLSERKVQGYFRTRHCIDYEKDSVIAVDGEHYINFASNDYLGMRQHQGVLQAWVEGLSQFGGGSGASPLVTGYTKAHAALEAYLADRLAREAVLLFNSGFAANQALCQCLFANGGEVLTDKYMHASFLDGAMASHAALKRFKHNDLSHLTTLLENGTGGDRMIASEGIFSMDGDSAPVMELAALAEQHNAWLMLDDAHGFGVLGEDGLGTVQAYQLTQKQLPVLMGTFGKAVGTAGAFIAGSAELIGYLVNHARHYIYSTHMPGAQAVATLYSLTEIAHSDARRRLFDNIAYFRAGAEKAGLTLTDSESAIQPVIVGSPHKALAMSLGLRKRGIWVPAIRYPTVPKHTDRLRITLNADHSHKDIDVLLDALMLTTSEVAQ